MEADIEPADEEESRLAIEHLDDVDRNEHEVAPMYDESDQDENEPVSPLDYWDEMERDEEEDEEEDNVPMNQAGTGVPAEDDEYIAEVVWDEEEDDEPRQSTYQHYPLLTSGIREEEEEAEESPIHYVDDNQLKRYADSVSMATYENDEADNDTEQEDTENNQQNEEEKSGNFIEVLSPHDIDVAPEEMDPRTEQRYSEEVDGPPFYWDEMAADATDLPVDNQELERTTYAWDALESTEPDHTETERDEPLEESTEEENQPADTTDTGEAEGPEGSTDNDGSEASGSRTRRPNTRRPVNTRRRLGKPGDWMIG